MPKDVNINSILSPTCNQTQIASNSSRFIIITKKEVTMHGKKQLTQTTETRDRTNK